MLNIVFVCFYLILSYIVGSIPTGYWLAKALKGVDLRELGSGSTGATNVYRCVGKGAGISVFFIDFLKGCLPVTFCFYLFASVNDIHHIIPVLVAMATLIGHSRSIFLGFKGGKSAATGLGTLLALKAPVAILTFTTWLVVLYLGKMVSVASILATAMCIPYMYFLHGAPLYVLYCTLGFLYVTIRHKENIKRILAGTEPKISK